VPARPRRTGPRPIRGTPTTVGRAGAGHVDVNQDDVPGRRPPSGAVPALPVQQGSVATPIGWPASPGRCRGATDDRMAVGDPSGRATRRRKPRRCLGRVASRSRSCCGRRRRRPRRRADVGSVRTDARAPGATASGLLMSRIRRKLFLAGVGGSRRDAALQPAGHGVRRRPGPGPDRSVAGPGRRSRVSGCRSARRPWCGRRPCRPRAAR